MNDTRNVMDEFKGVSHDTIVGTLDDRGVMLEIAIENLTRDYNMGTIVRSANAFGVRTIHIIGSRQWNKRGAMKTDAYVTIKYWKDITEFTDAMKRRHIVAVDIVPGAKSCIQHALPESTVLLFGAEGPGLSKEALDSAHEVVMIPQRGSTRSINVGVAAGIVMYEWMRQHGY